MFGTRGDVILQLITDALPGSSIETTVFSLAAALDSGNAWSPRGILAIDLFAHHSRGGASSTRLYHALIASQLPRFLVIDASTWDSTVVANGLHMQRDSTSLAPISDSEMILKCAGVCIAALSYYAPNLALNASSAEAFHVSPGRYTMGRG